MPRITFIPIASPKLRSAPPTGSDWLHEIKFDGFRIQLHKDGRDVRLFSRNGKDFTSRFPSIVEAVSRLPTRSAVIDGELVACDAEESQISTRSCGDILMASASGALICSALAAAICAQSRAMSAKEDSKS